MSSHIAVYRLLLYTYPARFRLAYGVEMARLFADMLADQRRPGQRLGVARLWVHTFVDTVSNATRQRLEERMSTPVNITRTLLIAIPIAFIAAYAFAGGIPALLVLIAGTIVLVARRRSLPDAITGSRRGRWWLWTLAGAVMIAGSAIAGARSGEFDAVRWMIFSGVFVAGALVVAASVLRAIALGLRRPRIPSAQ